MRSGSRSTNRRARAVLRSDDTLVGPDIEIGGQRFAVGDRVICRAPTRLRPAGGERGTEVRNGTRGTITAINPGPAPSVTVDFDNLGPIDIPTDLLTKRIGGRSVIGIITHAYCLTTHAAQGDTYQTGRMLTTDAASSTSANHDHSRGSDAPKPHASFKRSRTKIVVSMPS